MYMAKKEKCSLAEAMQDLKIDESQITAIFAYLRDKRILMEINEQNYNNTGIETKVFVPYNGD